MSLIARMKHISPTTVIRILRSLRPKTVSLNQPLPEVVCFDEFKSVKNVSGAMSFVMMDGKTHQLIDIVENRQLNPLRDYFLRYPRKVREQVRLVVSDFYTPYRTLVKECFPNARIVADRFHISQHIGRAFTNHRIQVMKTFKKGDRRSKHLKKYWRLLQKNAWELKGQHRYWRPSFRDHLTEAEIVDRLLSYDDSLKRGYDKHLKKYWRLLQKNAWELKGQHRYWRPSFRDHLTEAEIVDRLLSYDDSLKRGYEVYQDFLSVIRRQDVPEFVALLKEDYKELPEHYQPVFTTFKKYQTEIKRALRVPYSNGPIECLNNHIKVLKRIAYGFRNFQNYRERIFLYRGKYFKKTKNTTQLTKARTTTRLDKIAV